jgi:hypothetical protein
MVGPGGIIELANAQPAMGSTFYLTLPETGEK